MTRSTKNSAGPGHEAEKPGPDTTHAKYWRFLSFVIAIGLAIVLAFAVHMLLGTSQPQMHVAIWASVFLGFVTPVAIIVIRHEVRLSRIKLIDLFAETFNFVSVSTKTPGRLMPADPRYGQNVSFEFVKGKYYADLDLPRGHVATIDDVPTLPMTVRSDWMMLLCAIPYMVIACFGTFILFAPVVEVMTFRHDSPVGSWLWPTMLALGGADINAISDPVQVRAQHVNVMTVTVLAFSGAYFYSLRLLLRAVAVFDLSPVTFLRCFVHILLAMLLAIVIYRVFPSDERWSNALGQTAQFLQNPAGVAPAPPAVPVIKEVCVPEYLCPPTGAAAGVSVSWLIIAFALGFIPDSALQFVLRKSGLSFKERYGDLDPHAKLVPVTVIDGIDSYIAYRLEEANIFDVQNLATANPIMLHIESPFGIYETIDWVAQAQLCTVAGPDRFLMLKTLNIRTIFDLERAVMKPVGDLVAESLSDRAAAACVQAERAADAAYETRRLATDARQVADQAANVVSDADTAAALKAETIAEQAETDAAEAKALAEAARGASEAYAAFENRFASASGRLRKPGVEAKDTPDAGADIIAIIGQLLLRDNVRDKALRDALTPGNPAYPDPAGPSVASVRHMVMVMLDDLHVHRLRQIWKHIARQLGDANGHL